MKAISIPLEKAAAKMERRIRISQEASMQLVSSENQFFGAKDRWLSILLILLVLFHAAVHCSSGQPPKKCDGRNVEIHSALVPARLNNAENCPNESGNGKGKPEVNEEFVELNHELNLWIGV
jgi:hypothetical protein